MACPLCSCTTWQARRRVLPVRATVANCSRTPPPARLTRGPPSRYPTAAKGKRLVFTGHSLGGGIACLAAIRLLSMLPPPLHGSVSAIGFATPPLGNQALAEAVRARGWDSQILSYTLPEDWWVGATQWVLHRRRAATGRRRRGLPTWARATLQPWRLRSWPTVWALRSWAASWLPEPCQAELP